MNRTMEMRQLETKKIKKNHFFVLYIFALFILTFFVYHDYLLAEEYLLSTGNAMDLYDQFYPQLLTIARGLKNGELSSFMNFSYGVGMEVDYSTFALSYLPAYFGEENVAYLIGFWQAVKVFAAGIFFYAYLRKLHVSNYTAGIMSMAYAYCGHMIIRQFWLSYSNEVLLLAIWLFAFECFFQNKDIRWMPIATFIFFTNIGSLYYILLYTGLFSIYVLFRYTATEHKASLNIKKICLLIAFILFVALIAVGLTNIITQISSILSSDRFQQGVSEAAESEGKTAIFTGVKVLQSAFFRTIGINITGVKKDFYGEFDLLCDPTFYMGLFSLIFLPLCFVKKKGKEKCWFCLVFLATILYICSDVVRQIVNGFSSTNFKLSSFWIIFLSIFCVATELDNWFEKPTMKSVVGVVLTGFCIRIISNVLVHTLGDEVRLNYAVISETFILIYVLWVVLYYKMKKCRTILKGCLFLAIVAEVGFMGYTRIVEMDTLPSSYLSSRKGYNDYATDALEYIEDREEIRDYRIDKQFFSYRYNDAMAQDYYGTSFYFGGTGIGNAVIDFYDTFKLPAAGAGYKYAYGTSISDSINQVLGVKYVVANTKTIRNFGFEKIAKVEEADIYVYENKYVLPMVYAYDKYISRSDADEMSLDEKQCALLQACIVPDDVADTLEYSAPLVEVDNWKDCQNYAEYKVDVVDDGTYIYIPEYEEGSTIVLRVKFMVDEAEYRRVMTYYTPHKGPKASYEHRVDADDETYTFEISANYVEKVMFANEKGETDSYKLEACYIIPQHEYYETYCENVAKLQENAMEIEVFSGKCVEGTIELEQGGILYFAAPYSKWNVYIDDEKAETFAANIGYTGCEIEAGYHTIRMEYPSTEFSVSNILKKAVFLSFAVFIVYDSIRRKKMLNEYRR